MNVGVTKSSFPARKKEEVIVPKKLDRKKERLFGRSKFIK